MTGDVTPVSLGADDAVELAEMLEFLYEILDYSPGIVLQARLDRLTGGAYSIEGIRADLARFVFLLGGEAEHVVHGDHR